MQESSKIPFKVLVVDDSQTVRMSAQRFLREGGHEVLLAEDGYQALALLHDFMPDLVFCDILMPRLDGYQTCAIIRRNARFAHVPVLMLSSKDGVFDLARGRLAGAQDQRGHARYGAAVARIGATGRRVAPVGDSL